MLQTDPSVFASTAFHYLVVGGGPAGLTLAARLSEDPEIQVGLIEAGQYVHGMPQIDVPGYCGQLIGNPDFDWMMSTVPQKSLNDRAVFQPRGKVLGGCTAINFTLVTRATESEYNALEELGNDGWNWSEILNYLKRSETITMPSKEDAHKYAILPEADYHGTDGPVQKTSPRWFPDIHAHFMETMSTLGLKVNHEPQNGSNVGVFTGAYTIDPNTVTRSYATSAHFTPNIQRRNLHVLIAAEATKVLTRVDADIVVATGVEFQHSGTSYTAMATREVILCAGSLKTPQLLELSGIGNSAIINPLGISAVVDLPGVGENLQVGDHPGVPVIQEVKPDTQTFETLQDPAILGEQVALYAAEKKGMLSSIYPSFSLLPLRSFVEEAPATNLVKTVDEMDDDGKHIALFKKWFDDPQQAQIEIIGCPSWMPIGQPGEVSPNPGSRYVSFVVILMHPFSRGSVHIASADPLAAPAIDPKYLSNPVDVELFVQAVKFARKAMLTPPVGQYHLKYVQPGPEVDSDEEIRQWLLKYVGTMWHPLGTASMLPKEDGGVVNSKLVVYGTKNLRVVDASIIPLQLSCHLQATVYAIAEKAADIIKKAYA